MHENMNHKLLTNWIFGYQISKAIFVVAKLGIPDLLRDEALHYEVLAQKTKSHPSALYRLLKALASIEIFKEVNTGYFEHTAISSLLITTHEDSLHPLIMLYGNEQYQTWGDLFHSIVTGNDAFSSVFGQDFFAYLDKHNEYSFNFNHYLNQQSLKKGEILVEFYNFEAVRKIIDIGGGHGLVLLQLLKKYPNLELVVFDTQKTITAQLEKQALGQLNNSIKYVAGDFFKSIPGEADIYLLSNILHDWDEPQATLILQNCRQTINRTGKLLIMECVLSEEKNLAQERWLDLNMLVMLKGKERNKKEYESILNAAGFSLTNIILTGKGVDIIEALPN